MLRRFFLVLALAANVAIGQSGFYGTATGHPKAGELAPDLVFSRVLSAPEPGSWTPAKLYGQVTVLSFFPDISHNPQAVADWNARERQFASEHVRFVWITGEKQEALMPALAQHPVHGWVLYDPKGNTAKAYGLDSPVSVYIGPDRNIIGFDQGLVPDEQTLHAVLDGRITHTSPTRSTLRAFMEHRLVHLDTEPFRMPRADDHRPAFAPSYAVHITPSHIEQSGDSSSDDFWVLEGVTVKEAIERFYDVNPIRTVLPPSLDRPDRYDFAMLLPAPESREKMTMRMKQALEQYFHVTMEREKRPVDVYVVSTLPGRAPTVLPAQDGHSLGSLRSFSVGLKATGDLEAVMDGPGPQSINAIYSVSEEGTIDDLCHDLERLLDRPVVNETALEGQYQIQVNTPDAENDFLQRLREQTGLVISPGQRTVEFLSFHLAP